MENLETVQNALNTPDPTKIGVILAFAIQGTFIVFFVVSPIMGYFLARATATRANLVLAWCAGVLVILLGNFGVSALLRRLIPAEQLSDIALTVLCALGSVAAGILLARYITFWLSDPGKPQWVVEYESMQVEEMLPFERRKKQEVARRNRNRR